MQQVALSAIDDYLLRTEDDELTDRPTDHRARDDQLVVAVAAGAIDDVGEIAASLASFARADAG
jgi:hypothetical protein